jgi:GntR family transcriptional regulator
MAENGLFSFKLNKSSPIPLYFQLKEALLAHIAGLREGDPLPTEVEMCEHFDVSRPTVRQAIKELVAEGHVERQKGRGSFVSKPKVPQNFLFVVDSFNNEMRKKNLVPATKVLSLDLRSGVRKACQFYGIPEGRDLIYLSRLRSINSEPVVLVNSWLPPDKLSCLFEKDMEKESLYKVIEHDLGLPLAYTRRILEARAAGEFVAGHLGISTGSPVLYIETMTYTTGNVPIEYSVAYYRGDRNTFSLEISKQLPGKEAK